jgi:hypothetical protein
MMYLRLVNLVCCNEGGIVLRSSYTYNFFSAALFYAINYALTIMWYAYTL